LETLSNTGVRTKYYCKTGAKVSKWTVLMRNAHTHRAHWIFTTLLAACLCLFTPGCSSSGSRTDPTENPPAAQAARPVPGAAYENKLIRRPGSSPEDGKVYVVQNGKKRWVVNASWFAAHGFKFPEEVHEISAAELDAIPTGDPIQ
jgi:hypothetical protein